MTRTLDAPLVTSEELTPREFIDLYESNRRHEIAEAEIIPPRVGRRGDFGGVRVTYKHPTAPFGSRKRMAAW